MNVFMRELKAHRKSLIWWSIGMFFMIVSGMQKYAYYKDSGTSLTDLLDKMPKTMKAVLGFGTFDVTKASGFYGMMFLYLLIMVAIHAAMLGANIIAKEERDKTTEFLMVKPVSRTKVISAKLGAAVCNVVILNLITWIFSVGLLSKYAEGEKVNSDIAYLMMGMFLFQLIFLVLGTSIAAVTRRPKGAGSLATSILLVAFLMSIVVDMNSHLEWLKYITPFKYFDAAHVMYGQGLNRGFVVLSIGLIIVLTVSTYWGYKSRDLHV